MKILAFPIRVFLPVGCVTLDRIQPSGAAPISIDTANLRLSVEPASCRWSAEVKGTPMRLNDVHFLPGDDASGWTVTSSVNNGDSNQFGSFVTVSLRGANRFFYNGRVFWNGCDGFHIYKYTAPDGQLFNYGNGKVDACFHAIAGSTLFVSEAFNVLYPADRIELLKRISPPTMDVAYPVDLFVDYTSSTGNDVNWKIFF